MISKMPSKGMMVYGDIAVLRGPSRDLPEKGLVALSGSTGFSPTSGRLGRLGGDPSYAKSSLRETDRRHS
jgi:hypothetical protein